MKYFSFCLVFATFVFSTNSHARQPDFSQADDYLFSITASYMHKVTVFGIIDKSTDNEKAVFVDKGLSPYIQIASTDLLKSTANDWHIIIEAGYTDFEVGRQQDENDNEVNLGTSIKGKYYYVMPVLYHSRVTHRENGFKFGLGGGLAMLDASGTAIYNKTADKTTVHNISVHDAGLILGGFASYQWSDFHIRVRVIGAGFNGNDNINQDNRYAVGEAGIDLGYSLYF